MLALAVLTSSLVLAQAAPVEVRLSAERLLHDGAHDRTTAEGRATLRTADAAIDADRILYEKREGRITAVGHVVARLAQQGLTAVLADTATVVLDGDVVREVSFLDGHAYTRKGVGAEQFLAATSEEEINHLGAAGVRLEGNRLVRDGAAWRLEHLTLVPCDCDLAHPTWGISGSSATVDQESERASLWFPRIWIGPLPVFWAPWLSVPLSNRASGLLFPKPSGSGLNGFTLEQPVFVTLGRSADLTLTPAFIFGASPPVATADKPIPDRQNPYGVRGPRLGAEFRYTPAVGTEGRLAAGLLYDQLLQRDPFNPYNLNPLGTGEHERGLRWELGWTHAQALPHGVSLRADVNAYSDGNMVRDLVSDVLGREATYLRSSAVAAWRGRDAWVGLDAVVRQDLQYGFGLFQGLPPAGASTLLAGPAPIQRLPALTASLPARTLVGPVAWDATASLVRHAAIGSPGGDEGTLAREGRELDPATGLPLSYQCLQDRLYTPGAPHAGCGFAQADKLGMGDRVWQPGEREGRDRIALRPRLLASFRPGDVVSVSGWAGWHQTAWWGEQSGQTGARGYPILDARAETAVFGAPVDGWTHVLRPVARARAVPLTVGASPAPYDEVDLAIPSNRGRAQATLELQQRLSRRGSNSNLTLDLGQGADLAAPEVGRPTLNESWARLGGGVGWFSAWGAARVDPVRGLWTRRSVQASFDDGAGHGVSAAFDDLLDDGTARTRGGMDVLFGPRLQGEALTRSQLLVAAVWWRAGPISLRYDIRAQSDDPCAQVKPDTTCRAAQADGTVGLPLVLKQDTLSVGISPACDCWRLDVFATHQPTAANFWRTPNFGFALSVSNFGTLGSAR